MCDPHRKPEVTACLGCGEDVYVGWLGMGERLIGLWVEIGGTESGHLWEEGDVHI